MFILAKKKYASIVLDKEGYTYPNPKISITVLKLFEHPLEGFAEEKIMTVCKNNSTCNTKSKYHT